MIDELRRKRLAEEIRHLVTGQVTNDDFVDRTAVILKESKDLAVKEIWEGAYGLFSDMHKYKLRGKYAIKKEIRHEIARWIVFLYSDLEYGWPVEGQKLETTKLITGIILWPLFLLVGGFIVLIATFSLAGLLRLLWDNDMAYISFMPLFFIIMGVAIVFLPKLYGNYRYKQYKQKLRRHGNPDVWPFIRQEDFDRYSHRHKLKVRTK